MKRKKGPQAPESPGARKPPERRGWGSGFYAALDALPARSPNRRSDSLSDGASRTRSQNGGRGPFVGAEVISRGSEPPDERHDCGD